VPSVACRSPTSPSHTRVGSGRRSSHAASQAQYRSARPSSRSHGAIRATCSRASCSAMSAVRSPCAADAPRDLSRPKAETLFLDETAICRGAADALAAGPVRRFLHRVAGRTDQADVRVMRPPIRISMTRSPGLFARPVHRLNVIRLRLPRARTARDIALLARHFLAKSARGWA